MKNILTRTRPLLIAVGVLAALTACDTDTPLGVDVPRWSVEAGQTVTGTVVNPDGKITVTLAPASTPVPKDLHWTEGERPCDYRSSKRTFVCATDGLAEGRYAVQVTDAAQPGEGTAKAFVAITGIPGYQPRVRESGETLDSGKPVTLHLTGWGPRREVHIRMRDEQGKAVHRGTVTTDASGNATVAVGTLADGVYEVAATDGLWQLGWAGYPYDLITVGAGSSD